MWHSGFVNGGGKREGVVKDDSRALDILKRINSGVIHYDRGKDKILECKIASVYSFGCVQFKLLVVCQEGG